MLLNHVWAVGYTAPWLVGRDRLTHITTNSADPSEVVRLAFQEDMGEDNDVADLMDEPAEGTVRVLLLKNHKHEDFKNLVNLRRAMGYER